MPVIVVANPKGGVGKSTLATNLAGYLASRGHAVMLGDVDRQQSSRTWLDAAARPALPTISTWEIDPRRRRAPAQGHDARRARHARRPARQAPRRGDEARRQGAGAAAAEHLRHPRHARLRAASCSTHRRSDQVQLAVVGMRTREGTIATDQLRSFLGRLRRAAARLPARHAELRAPRRARPDAVGRRARPLRARPASSGNRSWSGSIECGLSNEDFRQAQPTCEPLVGQHIADSDWIDGRRRSASTCSPTPPATTSGSTSIPERAAAGPFGTTDRARLPDAVAAARDGGFGACRSLDTRMGVNYGLNKVRFPAPVPAGSRLRGRFKLLEVTSRSTAARSSRSRSRWSAKARDKPVCIAESVARRYVSGVRFGYDRPAAAEAAMKVLLIDDHPLILSALQNGDRGPGRRRHGRRREQRPAAREALAAEASDFDLVLLDLQPRRCRRLRPADRAAQRLPGGAGGRGLGLGPQRRRDPRDRPRRDGLRAQARQQRDAVRGAARRDAGRHLRAADDDERAKADSARRAATPCRAILSNVREHADATPAGRRSPRSA